MVPGDASSRARPDLNGGVAATSRSPPQGVALPRRGRPRHLPLSGFPSRVVPTGGEHFDSANHPPRVACTLSCNSELRTIYGVSKKCRTLGGELPLKPKPSSPGLWSCERSWQMAQLKTSKPHAWICAHVTYWTTAQNRSTEASQQKRVTRSGRAGLAGLPGR